MSRTTRCRHCHHAIHEWREPINYGGFPIIVVAWTHADARTDCDLPVPAGTLPYTAQPDTDWQVPA